MVENPTSTPPAERRPDDPYVPASTILPEITVKAVVLGIVLSVVLAAANAYLGLFAGLTVSASIPAAVISMAVLRLFRQSNILENNIVQTAASAGESLAAGVIFTIPAMVILGAWTDFPYWDIVLISGLGGVIGVMFTIPLRRALIVDRPLRFPEGVATAEVLKVGDRGGAGALSLLTGGAIGALFKLGSSGLRLWGEVFEWARFAGGGIAYVGTNLSPALVGVGYIIGPNIALVSFAGGALNWWVAIPVAAWTMGVPAGAESAAEAAGVLWSTQTRYIGVGAMILGGIWTLIRVRGSIISGVRSGLEAYRPGRPGTADLVERTERDAPMPWVGAAIAASALPLYVVFERITGSPGVALVMAVIMLVAGFCFSAVAGYMAGLVGSSNNPISGVTIATILTSALLLLLLVGTDSPIGPAAAILIGAVVCCAAAIAGDNMQDLKAGRILGATPVKQQIMQVVGVVAAAFVMAPVLTLLLTAYGIGAPTLEHPNPLSAPQASLMAAVARGVFAGGPPWGMVGWGIGLAAVVIGFDTWLERRGALFRTPVLAAAVGIYLPLELTAAVLMGGLIAWAAGRTWTRRASSNTLRLAALADARTEGGRNGLLFAAGLITGEALLGILLAVPIVIAGRGDILAFWGEFGSPWPGVALLMAVMFLLYRAAVGGTGRGA
jgi:putative OPT family oligopeptide transporter